jgi:hypothetical protein
MVVKKHAKKKAAAKKSTTGALIEPEDRFTGRFTEGFDTLDLKEAKALLDALTS